MNHELFYYIAKIQTKIRFYRLTFNQKQGSSSKFKSDLDSDSVKKPSFYKLQIVIWNNETWFINDNTWFQKTFIRSQVFTVRQITEALVANDMSLVSIEETWTVLDFNEDTRECAAKVQI